MGPVNGKPLAATPAPMCCRPSMPRNSCGPVPVPGSAKIPRSRASTHSKLCLIIRTPAPTCCRPSVPRHYITKVLRAQPDKDLAFDTTSLICLVQVRSLDRLTPSFFIYSFSIIISPVGFLYKCFLIPRLSPIL